MYAIIRDGSKQYKVKPGCEIVVDHKLKVEGEKLEFPEVLLVNDGAKTKIGTPIISGAKVVAEVVKEAHGKKLRVYKYKRRKGYHRTVGHRQQYTVIKVTDIVAG